MRAPIRRWHAAERPIPPRLLPRVRKDGSAPRPHGRVEVNAVCVGQQVEHQLPLPAGQRQTQRGLVLGPALRDLRGGLALPAPPVRALDEGPQLARHLLPRLGDRRGAIPELRDGPGRFELVGVQEGDHQDERVADDDVDVGVVERDVAGLVVEVGHPVHGHDYIAQIARD